MVKKVWNGLNKRKVKVFSLFLLCSFLAWLISNLSDQYESRIEVTLNYQKLPDSLLLGKEVQKNMEAKIRANGFQFLYYNFFKKQIDLDVSQALYLEGDYVLSEQALARAFEQQLSHSTSLIALDRDRLEVDMYRVASKEVPVKANLGLKFQQNYMLDGKIWINPSHILVKGPSREIDSLEVLTTSFLELTNVSADFSRELPLLLPKNMENSVFSAGKVQVTGRVSKFSEKVFEIPVKVLNVPEGYQVQTFPNTVKLVCKASLQRLKEISLSDFEVVADYGQLKSAGNSTLFLRVSQQPENVYDVRLQEGNTVNFILKQP